MPLTGATRTLVTIATVVGVLAIAGATVAWRSAEASTPSTPQVQALQPIVPEPATTTPTTVRPPAPAPTTTPSTTSTTVRPTTVPTTPRPRTTVAPKPPTTTPTTSAPAGWTAPVAQKAGTSPEERCAAARRWVDQQGLPLPAGWGFKCPGSAIVAGQARWGVACWNCDGTGNWIAVDIGRIGASDAALRYVVAHETCHAIDYMGLGITTEVGADLCAALHGAPRP